MSTGTDTEVQDYLDRLRRELAGLPAAEVEEIIQDVEPHLTALAEEPSDATLAHRLGDPAEYARELRGAMGVPDEPATTRRSPWPPRIAMAILAVSTVTAGVSGHLSGLVMSNAPRTALSFFCFMLLVSWLVAWLAIGKDRTTAGEIAALPEIRLVTAQLATLDRRLPVTDYLKSLRPGWFVAKAALVWLGVLWLCHWFGWYNPIPGVMAVACAALTILVSHRSRTDRRWLWLSVPLGGWAIGVALKAAELLPILTAGDLGWP